MDDEKKLKQDVAGFFTDGFGIVGKDCISQLVDLFNKIAGHGLRRLFTVPRTTVLTSEGGDQCLDAIDG